MPNQIVELRSGYFPAMKLKAFLVSALLLTGIRACGLRKQQQHLLRNGSRTDRNDGTGRSGWRPGAPGEKLERAVKVEIVNFAYGPDPVRVQAGGKVIWQNMDSAPHTATADDASFDTGALEEGKLKSEAFKQAGTYAYHCEIHPEMHGTVEVIEPE